MPEYTVLAVLAVGATVAYELAVLRSGIFGRRSYRITLAVCAFFMVLVNGWLTKLSAPIVWYAPAMKSPWRFPLDIPVEDFLFGFSLLTLVLARWDASAPHDPERERERVEPVATARSPGRPSSGPRPVGPIPPAGSTPPPGVN